MSWRRSPVLWFGLPGLIFLLIAWVDSMSHDSRLEITAFARSVSFRNSDSGVSTSFYTGRRPVLRGKEWEFQASREPDKGESWFPLPSHVSSEAFSSSRWHCFSFSYWFLILVYLGLWQLPWLWRYHRRQRIRRAMPEQALRRGGKSSWSPIVRTSCNGPVSPRHGADSPARGGRGK